MFRKTPSEPHKLTLDLIHKPLFFKMSHQTVTSLLEETTADSPGYIEICGKSKFMLYSWLFFSLVGNGSMKYFWVWPKSYFIYNFTSIIKLNLHNFFFTRKNKNNIFPSSIKVFFDGPIGFCILIYCLRSQYIFKC